MLMCVCPQTGNYVCACSLNAYDFVVNTTDGRPGPACLWLNVCVSLLPAEPLHAVQHAHDWVSQLQQHPQPAHALSGKTAAPIPFSPLFLSSALLTQRLKKGVIRWSDSTEKNTFIFWKHQAIEHISEAESLLSCFFVSLLNLLRSLLQNGN